MRKLYHYPLDPASRQARIALAEKKLKVKLEPIDPWQPDPAFMDMTPEGLRIQMVDDNDKPMFASGSAQMMQRTRLLVGTIAGIMEPLPNDISVRGHTDSSGYAPGADYTNWELSADRANASRKALEKAIELANSQL